MARHSLGSPSLTSSSFPWTTTFDVVFYFIAWTRQMTSGCGVHTEREREHPIGVFGEMRECLKKCRVCERSFSTIRPCCRHYRCKIISKHVAHYTSVSHIQRNLICNLPRSEMTSRRRSHALRWYPSGKKTLSHRQRAKTYQVGAVQSHLWTYRAYPWVCNCRRR